MLKITGLRKNFGDLDVLDGFDLSVPEGNFTVLIGPSGCGKSTLFDILTGIVENDGGRTIWEGKNLSSLGDMAAYMQQKDLLLPWLSLLDNALLPVTVSSGDMDTGRERALRLFERVGLGGFENYLPHRVSGGMRQRCALVRTLMFDRKLVLLDEPLSALDAITRRELQRLLVMMQREFGRTVLMITHDIDEALILADDIVVLSSSPMRATEHFSFSSPKPRSIGDPELLRIREHVLCELQEAATMA